MKIYQFKLETLLVCTGLFLSAIPQVWSMAVTTEVSTNKRDHSFSRSYTYMQPSLIQSTNYALIRNLATTIQWNFTHNYGVWGVMFNSFSIPSTTSCTSDYFSIWDPSGSCDNLRTVFCGDNIPENFVSCSSKIVIEYHSDSLKVFPNFTFRVDHGSSKQGVLERLQKEFIPPNASPNERVTMLDEEGKVVIISLSVILPVALAILGILTYILARHTQQDKNSSQESILPTKCPSSKKYVHTGNEKDSTVVKLYVDTERKPVKTTKVRLQELKTERVPLNDYADMPLNVCSTVALSDVLEEEADFEDRPNAYLGLM